MSQAALGTFVMVPPEFAQYEIDTDAAARILGVPPERAAELTADHLPHELDPVRGPLCDYVDVVNLAMFGATTRMSIPDLALRFLLRFATSPESTWYEPRKWLIRVRAPVITSAALLRIDRPDLAAPGVELLDPSAAASLHEAAPTTTTIEPPGYQVAVRITGAPDTIHDSTARHMYQEMLGAIRSGDVTYQAVSEHLRMRHTHAWELGMADCVVLSRLLAERLRTAGLGARARRGYLLGLVGSDHAWCEVYEDDRWKPLDIVFAFLAGGGLGTRRIEATPEFVAACCGSRFNRLLPCEAKDARALVHLDDEPAPPFTAVGVSAHTGEA